MQADALTLGMCELDLDQVNARSQIRSSEAALVAIDGWR
jgi:hypothetical protein